MARPDAIADSYDAEIDGPKASAAGQIFASTLISAFWVLLPGLWMGSQLVASFAILPAASHALSGIFAMSRHPHGAGPMSDMIYAYAAIWTNAAGLVCSVPLLVGSVGEALRSDYNKPLRIAICVLYMVAIGQLLWSNNIQMDLISSPYYQMAALQTQVSWTSLIQIGAVLIAVFLTEFAKALDLRSTSKMKI